MESVPVPAPPPPPTTPTIAFVCEMPCIHCGYDLRTILLSDRCPECGKPAADSRDSLATAAASDIARLRTGLVQTLVACAIVPVVAIGITLAASFSSSPGEATPYLVGALLAVGGPMLAWLGLYTTAPIAQYFRDPSSAGPTMPQRMAAALRALSPAYAVSSVVLYILLLASINGAGPGRVGMYFVVGVIVLTGSLWTARNFAACRLFSAVAARSNGKRTRVAFSILSWCSAGMFCHALLMGVLLLTLDLLTPTLEGSNLSRSVPAGRWIMTCFMIATAATYAFVLFWCVFWPIALLVLHRHLRTVLRLAVAHAGHMTGPLPNAEGAAPSEPALPTVR